MPAVAARQIQPGDTLIFSDTEQAIVTIVSREQDTISVRFEKRRAARYRTGELVVVKRHGQLLRQPSIMSPS